MRMHRIEFSAGDIVIQQGDEGDFFYAITEGKCLVTRETPLNKEADGTIILTFTDCSSGTIEYDIPSIGQTGLVPIQRVAADNVALCVALAE